MSGDQHNQADPPDLDDIEARADITDTAIVCGSGPFTEVGRREARRLLGEDVPALVAEVRRLRALSARLRDQLQHECPHGEMSWSGLDQTPLDDPAKVWVCDNCAKTLGPDNAEPTCNCDLPPVARLVLCPVHYRGQFLPMAQQ